MSAQECESAILARWPTFEKFLAWVAAQPLSALLPGWVRWAYVEHHMPTPAEEPNVGVRLKVAARIAAKYLTRLLTPAEEPNACVRDCVARRISKEA
jgi:hypothetical protein